MNKILKSEKVNFYFQECNLISWGFESFSQSFTAEQRSLIPVALMKIKIYFKSLRIIFPVLSVLAQCSVIHLLTKSHES